MIAPMTAASTVCGRREVVSMIPLPTVAATAVVTNAPKRFATEATSTAIRGESARVEMLVATAFAVSWKPFVKSKTSATAIVMTSSVKSSAGQRFLTRIASSTSAAFSQASTASSICSWMSFQRMIVSGFCSVRKRSAIASRDEPVALVLELAQRVELPLRVAVRPRAARPPRAAATRRGRRRRPAPARGRDVAHLVGVDVVGGLVDVVADVVDRRGEPVHVVAVERRDERAVEQVDHLVREPVALVLGLADVGEPRAALGPVVQQVDEQAGDLARVGRRLGEQVEELALLRGEVEPGHARVFTTRYHSSQENRVRSWATVATDPESPRSKTPSPTPAAR